MYFPCHYHNRDAKFLMKPIKTNTINVIKNKRMECKKLPRKK